MFRDAAYVNPKLDITDKVLKALAEASRRRNAMAARSVTLALAG